jgi:hypothetical protein
MNCLNQGFGGDISFNRSKLTVAFDTFCTACKAFSVFETHPAQLIPTIDSLILAMFGALD